MYYVHLLYVTVWPHTPSDEMEDTSYQFEQEPTDLPVGIAIRNLVKVTLSSSPSATDLLMITMLLLTLHFLSLNAGVLQLVPEAPREGGGRERFEPQHVRRADHCLLGPQRSGEDNHHVCPDWPARAHFWDGLYQRAQHPKGLG